MGKGQEEERRRNQIIQNAVEAADEIILDGSDGSVEETNFLTAGVARKFVERALLPFQQALFHKDITDSTNDIKPGFTDPDEED